VFDDLNKSGNWDTARLPDVTVCLKTVPIVNGHVDVMVMA